jgi:hypothetical protein
MKWLRFQRVISLETQVGTTRQRNKWANTDIRVYRKWDQVPRRSKHPLRSPDLSERMTVCDHIM